MGIRASSTRELIFNNVKVPKENLVGKEGRGLIIAQGTLDASRPGVAAQALGIAAGALDEAVEYARNRVQFGQPIASFQGIQHMMADMATEIEAARCLLYQAARMMDANPGKRTTKESAMAKLYSSQLAQKIASLMVEVLGGYGFTREYPVEKFYRDSKIGTIYEGTSNMQLQTIAKVLLKD